MNSIKRHISHVKNSGLGHDLPTPVNDRVISPFCENKILAKISEITVVKRLKDKWQEKNVRRIKINQAWLKLRFCNQISE